MASYEIAQRRAYTTIPKKTHTLYVIKNNHKMQHIKQDFSRFALEALLLGQNFISRTISPPRTLLLIKSSLKERENRICR